MIINSCCEQLKEELDTSVVYEEGSFYVQTTDGYCGEITVLSDILFCPFCGTFLKDLVE